MLKQYEYKKEELINLLESHDKGISEVKLNKLGKQGWSLVTLDNGQAIFKREKVAEREDRKTNSSSLLDFTPYRLNTYRNGSDTFIGMQVDLLEKEDKVQVVLDRLLDAQTHTKVELKEFKENRGRILASATLIPKVETKYNVKLDHNTGHPIRELTLKYDNIRDLLLSTQTVADNYDFPVIGIKQISNKQVVDFTVDNLVQNDIKLLMEQHDAGERMTYGEEELEVEGVTCLVKNSIIRTSKGYALLQEMTYPN
ncbi:hypothetical protein P9X10_00965 [Bacillus cereus]|nr:hypothetical protein [Bacillus cereus]